MAENGRIASIRERIEERRTLRRGIIPPLPRLYPVKRSQRAYGFDRDFSTNPFTPVKSTWGNYYNIALNARLGLYCHNFHHGTNFKFNRWEKYSTMMTGSICFYITFDATDPASGLVFSFQTLFCDFGRRSAQGIRLSWMTRASRIQCNEALDDEWDSDEVDKFYKGPMPKWFSDEALARDNKKYYVVQESELHDNDWLQLLMEIAFFSRENRQLDASPPLKIKKVVVETKEEYTTDAREKLRAKNAIYYISYKCNADPSTGWAGDHEAIIRKTMDGKPGHMHLEVALTKEQQQEVEK